MPRRVVEVDRTTGLLRGVQPVQHMHTSKMKAVTSAAPALQAGFASPHLLSPSLVRNVNPVQLLMSFAAFAP